jgi:membrane-associated phospholipid phosphatase
MTMIEVCLRMRRSYAAMRELEILVIVYAVAYGLWAVVAPARARRGLAVLVALGTVALVLAAGQGPTALRLLAPQLYLVVGYWIPALAVRRDADTFSPSNFERWLTRTDLYFRPRLPHVPSALGVLAETAYLLCYPIVPLALAIVWLKGGADTVPRFWMTVVISGFACYASLPWLLSRPPQREGLGAMALRQTNRYVLARVSHTWTTFPSGHVAVSSAAALAVFRVWPPAGVVLAMVAVGIAIGAAAGRYHFVLDVLLGAIVAIVAVVIT